MFTMIVMDKLIKKLLVTKIEVSNCHILEHKKLWQRAISFSEPSVKIHDYNKHISFVTVRELCEIN